MRQIVDVVPNKSMYVPSEPVEIIISVENTDDTPFAGTLVVSFCQLETVIDKQAIPVALQQGEIAHRTVTYVPPADPMRGYGIDVHLGDGGGEVVATASGAFDVLDRWSQAPRYGFLSSFGPNMDSAAIEAAAASLRRFHLNVVQFYDWMWRHYCLLPPEDDFTDALGRRISLQVVRDSISAMQRIGAAAFAYGAVYGAEPEYTEAHPELVLVDKDGKPYSLAELFFIMDIAPESPWTAMIVNEFAETIRVLDFDGIHLDQYGFPKGTVWTRTCESRDLARDFPLLIDAAREAVRREKPSAGVIFNAVENWPIATVAPTTQDAIYIEVWPPDEAYADLRRLIQDAKRLGRGQQVILAAYLAPFLEEPHAPESEAAALLATAVIASSGGFHLLLGERNGILCDPYYPKFGTLRDEFVPRLRAYYDYLVRYEEWLTMPTVVDWDFAIDHTMVTTSAIAGKIWLIARTTASERIVHLVDFRGQSDDRWNAPRTPGSRDPETITLDLPTTSSIVRAFVISPEEPTLRDLSAQPTAAGISVDVPIAGPWTTVVVRLLG
ncbi:MAG: glycoside hydrolase family 66 protein [Thermomicrobiales bacterium]